MYRMISPPAMTYRYDDSIQVKEILVASRASHGSAGIGQILRHSMSHMA